MNSGLNVVYYGMGPGELKINKQNLSKSCGHNCEFEFVNVAIELRDNKVHAKTLKVK